LNAGIRPFKEKYCEGVGSSRKLPLKVTTTKDLSRQGEPTLGRRPRGSCKRRKRRKDSTCLCVSPQDCGSYLNGPRQATALGPLHTTTLSLHSYYSYYGFHQRKILDMIFNERHRVRRTRLIRLTKLI
jgi:hypothetical protein